MTKENYATIEDIYFLHIQTLTQSNNILFSELVELKERVAILEAKQTPLKVYSQKAVGVFQGNDTISHIPIEITPQMGSEFQKTCENIASEMAKREKDLYNKISRDFSIERSLDENTKRAEDIIYNQEYSFGDAIHLIFVHQDLEMFPVKIHHRELSCCFRNGVLVDENRVIYEITDYDMQSKWKLRKRKIDE